MAEQQTWILESERDRRFALRGVQIAPLGRQVKISRPTRTLEQNKLLHGLISDVAKQLPHPLPPRNDGEFHGLNWWKPRCTLSWLIELKDEKKAQLGLTGDAEVVTALEDGDEIGLLLPHTSDLTTEQCASLCEWILGFGGRHGVVWTEKQPEPPPIEPGDYR